ncbi:class I SAM-dependent methyltransferase [Calidifontibacter terrae]
MTSPRRGIARSARLFRAFRLEQTRPEVFYGALADDSIELLQDVTTLGGKFVLDVGAGPAEFAAAFRAAGARYVPVDHDVTVASVRDGGVVATAAALPFADNSVDIVFSSNVWEHVPDPEAVADELVRVTRPGGLVFLSYTNWLSPWGGHETSPWHWTGGERAARRYEQRHGHPPKNLVDHTLFRVSVRQGLEWARGRRGVEVLVARPRYLPDAAAVLLKVPALREVLTWNLLLVLRKR